MGLNAYGKRWQPNSRVTEIRWQRCSHSTDGTRSSQPAGWSCLAVKQNAASDTQGPIALSEGELLHSAAIR
ncbi:hypothetical protein CesoFtcFv8_027436 [Champsocephalus esox]|uniref:Uncharacterized protein n=1 Tax=Champsocephalus esox TaxID=159716 RepID=A0AAN8AY93_9TELE|nr:hypothetical protein CesoFtcFv8_027436 [Champsocephalus esox]